jgi:hypothetical protein
MEALTKLLSEKTGLPEDVVGKVVEAMIPLLQDKLPAPFDSQIEGILSGEVDAENLLSSAVGGGSGGLGGMLGSLFGGRKT